MATKPKFKTREEWLQAVVGALRKSFKEAGTPVPEKVRASCGFPSRSALSVRKRRIGEAWSPKVSTDAAHEILISPVLDDPCTVVGVLVHELCHVAVGVEHGHKSPFTSLCRKLGLSGKPSQMGLDVPAYLERYAPIVKPFGAYPHAKMVAMAKTKPQGTRLIKCVCGECGYTARITRTWIEEGAPTCPCGGTIEPAE